ncbi:hypothetical protein AXK11_05460 [Cephaloticoccus primus]|uniref:Peptidase M14 domain-containing protein n=1 Tax=Cephaloticoccus primus TaxID=1548207 RepID=A0A139SMH6_9BACT|nr:hypothetical protein AXK11_05460 [Cephaloticoccus primus]
MSSLRASPSVNESVSGPSASAVPHDQAESRPPPLADISTFLKTLRLATERAGGALETMGEVGGLPLFAWTKRVKPQPCALAATTPRPRVYISAGTHGDEAAGPLAVLELLNEGFFDARAHWFICPALNPLGLQLGTRENAQGIDLNRDYFTRRSEEVRAHTAWLQKQPPFDLTLCLHEDWESTGFYLYELNHGARPSLAQVMLDAVRPLMPIEPAQVIDGRPIDEPGILRPQITAEGRSDWPEPLYLHEQQHSDRSYTLETPSSLPLAQRVAAQRAIVAAAVDAVLKEHSAAAG